jgi:hypothetical protein
MKLRYLCYDRLYPFRRITRMSRRCTFLSDMSVMGYVIYYAKFWKTGARLTYN